MTERTDSQGSPADPPQSVSPAALDTGEHHAPDDEAMARAEAKPPLYRFFRGSLYVTYMAVVLWFTLSLIVGVYRAFLGRS